MYQKGIVATIKVNGSVLREFGEQVALPFGTEYSIYLSNLNSSRAQISVSIDGQDQLDGDHIVLEPHQSMELKRSIRSGNMLEGNSFKFTERTAGIEAHRGTKAEDGLVRVVAQLETVRSRHLSSSIFAKSINASSVQGSSLSSGHGEVLRSHSLRGQPATQGITVPGAVIQQHFRQVASFQVDPERIELVLKLVGETKEEQQVSAPVLTTTKLTCSTCGTVSPSTAKFCGECGTSLIII